jgi:hypothetical protein
MARGGVEELTGRQIQDDAGKAGSDGVGEQASKSIDPGVVQLTPDAYLARLGPDHRLNEAERRPRAQPSTLGIQPDSILASEHPITCKRDEFEVPHSSSETAGAM